jgi:hypothetical protein
MNLGQQRNTLTNYLSYISTKLHSYFTGHGQTHEQIFGTSHFPAINPRRIISYTAAINSREREYHFSY